MPMISYAQNREDVLLARAFPAPAGFYIDVGAANPVGHSVTKWFYDRGWCGVNVEPQPLFFGMIVQDRPRDVNLNAAVSNEAGECTFYEVKDSLGTSTLNPALAEQIIRGGANVVPYTVKTITLAEICRQYVGGREIDFLKVDAEGHELAVLSSMDFTRWRPKVVVVETTEHETWEPLVLAAGYQVAFFDGLNRYYVRDEDAEALIPRLAVPVSCLDDYIPHEYASRIQELEHQLAIARGHEARARDLELELAAARQSTPEPAAPPPEPIPAPVPVAASIATPPAVAGPPFYTEGCIPGAWYKWPVTATRRLLRRLQRPFFFSLQGSLERLAEADARQQAAMHETAVALDRVASELRAEVAGLAARVGSLVENEGLHPLGVSDAVNALEWNARSARAEAVPARPLRVLFAVSSASQMYSGIGRAIFEVAKRVRGRIEYEFAVDDADARNVDLLAAFCREHRIPLHVGAAVELPHCLDRGNAALPGLLRRGGWDAVECVSWASAATNGMVLDHAAGQPVIYTPHYQPMWTVPGGADTYRKIDEAHGGLLRRAALVACDTPYEWLMLRAAAGAGVDCALLPLGFTPSDFAPGRPERRPYLLFVGDLKEQRKRFPLVVQVFAEVLRRHPGLQLVVVGNKSEEMGNEIPEAVRRQCVLMGYVSEEELRSLYRDAAGLMQLSDYEAFGLPILEALAAGTPVFLSRRPTVTGAFARYKGAVLIDDDTPARMAEAVSAALGRGGAFIEEVLADRPRLEAELSWDVLVPRRCLAIRSAVATRTAASAAA